MGLIVSTQSYKNDIPTEYGYLLEIDENSGRIIRKLKIDTPVTNINPNERIKPGLRGLYIYKGDVFVATWNKIIIVDLFSFEIKKELSHKWMSDLHGIFVNENGIWVTSSLPDAVILYDFEGLPQSSLWFPETFLYREPKKVDKTADWRKLGKNFRGFKEYHANHINITNNHVYVTGRGQNSNGKVIFINKYNFINKEYVKDESIQVLTKGLHGPHDGIWDNFHFWVTETLGSTIASINLNGKIKYRKKIKESENEKISFNGINDFIKIFIKEKFLNKPGKKMTHWTRGLFINDKHIYVGQSTKAGDCNSRARIIKIVRNNYEIADCFYLDIDNYPEMRIFQIIDNAQPTNTE